MQTFKTVQLIRIIIIELKTVVGAMNTCFSKCKWLDKSSWHFAVWKVSEVFNCRLMVVVLGCYFCKHEQCKWLQNGVFQQMTNNLHQRHGNPHGIKTFWMAQLDINNMRPLVPWVFFYYYYQIFILAESNAIRILNFHHDALSWQSKSACWR